MADQNPFAQFVAPAGGENPFAQFARQPAPSAPQAETAQPAPQAPPVMREVPYQSSEIEFYLPGQEVQTRIEQPDPIATAARDLDIDISEAPARIRAQVSFASDPREAYEVLLGKENVRVVDTPGPLQGEILWREGPEQRWKTTRRVDAAVGPTGPASIAGEMLPFAAGTVGGIMGAAGGIPGAMAGAGIGGLLGEFSRLTTGAKLGLSPSKTPTDLLAEAAVRGGWDALGAGAGGIILNAIKRYGMRAGLPSISMTAEELDAAIVKARQRIGRAGALSPTEMQALQEQATTGTLLGREPRAQMLGAVEQLLMREGTPSGAELTARRAQIEETLGRLSEAPTVLGQREAGQLGAPGFVPPERLGRGVAGAAPSAQAELEAGLAAGAGVVSPRGAAAPQVRPGFVDPLDPAAGAQLRDALETAETQMRRAAGSQIEAAKQRGISMTSTLGQSQQVAKDELAKIDLNLVPGITQQDKTVVQQLIDSLTPKQPTTSLIGLQPPPAGPVQVGYEQIEATLSALRRVEQAAVNSTGGDVTVNTKMLGALENALIRDRNAALAKLPDGQQIVNDLTSAEQAYRTAKDTFRRTQVERYIATNSRGKDIIADDSLATRLLSDPAGARQISNILQTQGFAADRELIRSVLRFDIARKAGAMSGGQEINDKALQDYLVKNRGVLRNFFSDQEITGFRRIGGWAQGVRRVLGVENLDDMGKWYDNFYSASDADQARAVMNRLNRYDRNNPGSNLEQTVRAYTKQRLVNEFSDIVDGRQVLNTSRILKEMEDPRRVGWLSNVLDPGFRDRMKTFAEVAIAMRPPAPTVSAREADITGGRIQSLQQIKTLTLGVLNAVARTVNNFIIGLTPGAKEKVGRALLDPEYFAQLMARGEVTTGQKRGAAALGAAIMEYNEIAGNPLQVPNTPQEVGGTVERMQR